MPHDLRKYLADIRQALQELGELKAQSLAEYQQEILLRRGVEREFIIIGEAIAQMMHQFPETRDRIEHARRIANFRNLLVHEYGEVDDEIVWDVLLHSVPLLKQQVDSWMSELDSSPKALPPASA